MCVCVDVGLVFFFFLMHNTLQYKYFHHPSGVPFQSTFFLKSLEIKLRRVRRENALKINKKKHEVCAKCTTDTAEIQRFKNTQKHETPNKVDTKELQLDLI